MQLRLFFFSFLGGRSHVLVWDCRFPFLVQSIPLKVCRLFALIRDCNSSIKREREVKKNTNRKNKNNATNNALLTNFLLSSDAEILSTITDGAYKSAPNMQKHVCNLHMFQLSFHFCIPPLVVGEVKITERKKKKALSTFLSFSARVWKTAWCCHFLLPLIIFLLPVVLSRKQGEEYPWMDTFGLSPWEGGGDRVLHTSIWFPDAMWGVRLNNKSTFYSNMSILNQIFFCLQLF